MLIPEKVVALYVQLFLTRETQELKTWRRNESIEILQTTSFKRPNLKFYVPMQNNSETSTLKLYLISVSNDCDIFIAPAA
jgi:hypothetical protein